MLKSIFFIFSLSYFSCDDDKLRPYRFDLGPGRRTHHHIEFGFGWRGGCSANPLMVLEASTSSENLASLSLA
jgi:hypothetical protein